MSRVEQMQAEIVKLPPEDFRQLADWIAEERNRKWDEQIEADSKSGKLQKLYEKLADENKGEAAVPLDDFLDEQKLP